MTPRYPGSAAFDARQPFVVERTEDAVLLPTQGLRRRIQARADGRGDSLVVLDPGLPLAWLARNRGLGRPYVVMVHGAEMTVPGHLPLTGTMMAKVLTNACLVIASGSYPAEQAESIAGRRLPVEVITPGVDGLRFRPATDTERSETRSRLGIAPATLLVSTVSRLVPRKGVDVLIAACRLLALEGRDLALVVGGEGRDQPRLERLAADAGLPVRFLGSVAPAELPGLMGGSDVFVMLCRNRWGGLEQEGFGIVFLESAACGVAVVAGASGGAADAVDHGRTGFVVARPQDPAAAAAAIGQLLDNPDLRRRMGEAGRSRAVSLFSHEALARRLGSLLQTAGQDP